MLNVCIQQIWLCHFFRLNGDSKKNFRCGMGQFGLANEVYSLALQKYIRSLLKRAKVRSRAIFMCSNLTYQNRLIRCQLSDNLHESRMSFAYPFFIHCARKKIHKHLSS